MWPCEAQHIQLPSSNFQKELGDREEDVLIMYHSFRHSFPSERVKGLKTIFFYPSLPTGFWLLPKWEAQNGKLGCERENRTSFLQHLEVPSAVSAATNGSVSARCDGSRASSRSKQKWDSWSFLTFSYHLLLSCPSRKLALWTIPCVK